MIDKRFRGFRPDKNGKTIITLFCNVKWEVIGNKWEVVDK